MATVEELDAKVLVDVLVDKLSEIKAKTLCYVDFGELLHTLAHKLNCRLRNLQTHHVI